MSTHAIRRQRAHLVDTIGVVAVVIGLVLGLLPGVALASHGSGPLGATDFEIDGNTAAGSGHDWSDIATYADGGALPDDGQHNDDTTWFKGSMVESTYPNWKFVEGGNAQKSDLHKLFVASQVAGEDSYLWLGASRLADNGSTQVTVEFNQADGETLDLGTGYRLEGDFYITWNFPGKPSGGQQPDKVQVKLGSWPDGRTAGSYPTEISLGDAFYDYAVGDIAGGDAYDFIELQLDLGVIFGDGEGDLGLTCGQFGAVSFRTESSGGGGGGTDESTLKDVAGPFPIDLNTCSDVEVRKVDAEGDPLEGASFAAFAGEDVAATGDAAATCETDATGGCSLGELLPGWYTLHEVRWDDVEGAWVSGAPDGYDISPQLVGGYSFQVESNTSLHLPRAEDSDFDPPAFVDPRIPYTISVVQDATNALNEDDSTASEHEFTVTLTDDQGGLVGETVDLSWDDGTIGDIIRVNGVDITATDSTTCTTRADDGGTPADEAGTCLVVVNTSNPGGGTLTASWDTPYQDTVSAPAETPSTTAVEGDPPTVAYPTIADSATKDWVGLDASIGTTGLNLLGQPHPFIVTVWEVDGEGNDDGTDEGSKVSGVTVTVDWDAGTATGSVIDDDPLFGSSSPTQAQCTTDGDGQCTVYVNSTTAAGTGTASISKLSGTVTGGETAVTNFGADERTAQKTWREYAAFIDSDSVNPAGQYHTFTVTVKYRDDAATSWEDASLAPDDTTVGYSLDWGTLVDDDDALADPPVTGSTCDDGTTGGTCTIVVHSDAPGQGTVTVDTVNGDLLDDGGEQADGPYDVADVEATKTWLDFVVNISDPAVNQVGESHTFWVDASWSDDGSDYQPVPEGTTLIWTDSNDSRVTDDTCSVGGTGDHPDIPGDQTNYCSITVNSSTPGTFTVTVTGVAGYQFSGPDRTEDVDFNESAESSKTWIAYRASIAPDGLNRVRDEHPFTVTVEQDTGNGDGWVAVPDTTTVTLTSTGLSTDGESCDTTAGQCTVTVNSTVAGSQTLTVATVETLDAVDSEFTTIDVSSGVDLDEDQEASATKTWVAFRAWISSDSVNITGDDHVFLVNAEYDDGTGWQQLPDGSSVAVSDDSADPGSVGGIDSHTCGDTTAVDAEDDYVCTVTVASTESGQLEVTVDGLSATITANGITDTFDVTFAGDEPVGVLDGWANDSNYVSTKTWASYTLDLTPDAAVNLLPVDPNHTFTAVLTSDDATNAPVGGQTINVTIDGEVGTITSVGGGGVIADGGLSATCITTEVAGEGRCDIVVTSTTPGDAEIDVWYSAEVGDSEPLRIDTEASTKIWTTYRVTVTPERAVNLVGNDHVFTVLVETSSAEGVWTPVIGAKPSVELDAETATIEGNTCPAGTVDDDPLTLDVDEAGTCLVTVKSDNVEAVTVTAEYEASIDQSTAAFSDSGRKEWIDYDLVVSPDDENLVDTEHTFTVTITTTFAGEEGPITEPVPGAFPSIQLDGPGGIVADGNTCATAGTDAAGTCTVTISSGVTGVTTVTATYGGTAADDAEVRDYVDSGDKLWVEYALEITPELATNAVGDDHTFTATLTVDTGEGFGPAAGETLQFELGGVGDAIGGDVDGDLACTTDQAGECDIVIVSEVGGTTTVDVSYGAVVGETSATYSDQGVKVWVDIDLVKTAVVGDGFGDGDLVEDPNTGLPTLFFTSSDRGPKTAVFEYLITNTGGGDLFDLALVDDRLGGIDLSTCPDVLEVGASCTARASEQFDYDDAAGGLDPIIVNVGVVTASGDDGSEVSDTDDAAIQLIAQQSSILIDLEKDVVAGAGDVEAVDGPPTVTWSEEELNAGASKTVRYAFTITNIGSAPIVDVELVDPMISDSPIIAVADGVTLQPGESIVVEVDHELTAAEAFPDGPTAGDVPNVATVSGANETRDSFDQDTDDAVVFVQVVFAEVVLPATGLTSGGLLPVSVLLIAVGAAILWLERRRTAIG